MKISECELVLLVLLCVLSCIIHWRNWLTCANATKWVKHRIKITFICILIWYTLIHLTASSLILERILAKVEGEWIFYLRLADILSWLLATIKIKSSKLLI